MEKIALITDSACDIDIDVLNNKNIKLLPLRIIYKDKEFQDKIEISPSEVYSNLEKEIPTTSLPSLETTENILNSLEADGYTHVIGVSISSGLSGTYNSLRLALEDHPNLKSFVFDTKILAYPQGEIVLEAAELIEQGKSFEEICEYLPKLKERVFGYFTLSTLEYLKKGGRIGRVAGTVGELLNLKPIISPDDNGVYHTVSKARGRKQSLSKLTEILQSYSNEKECQVTVLHAGCESEATKYMDSLKSLANVNNLKLAEISPALGVHTGPGLIGLSIKVHE